MSVLTPAQRKLLSDKVSEARDVVEAACARRISALGVAADKAPDNLNEEARQLRRGLRARARQLGSLEVLVGEAGYEHWHRMLFTRFLADNRLLVDDQTGQPVSMDEVADYAAELGEADVWEVAARFGAAMLPGIFRQDDPLLQMRLPVETRQRLEELLSALPPDIITADDALGWVYQYWQARRKDEVNRAERKIGGADLAPVTQLFTEDYMVRFLLENSLGAWWASRHPESPLLKEWTYLRFSDDGMPAAGIFDTWPATAAEVTVLDPCCGSGHFLVVAFEMLWRMRAEEQGVDAVEAQSLVLRDNLFGLELDPRCTQIAAFALALQAWRTGGYRALTVPNIACTGIPVKTPLVDWTALAGDDDLLKASLSRLHALFANADTLGSLIDPIRASEDAGLESMSWSRIAPLLAAALGRETRTEKAMTAAAFEAITNLAHTADLLSRRYTLVCTNPPYLGRGAQVDLLRSHCVHHYPEAEAELALVMAERWKAAATQAVVLPQAWLFTSTFERYRRAVLKEVVWQILARLGYGAFGSISGQVVQVVLLIQAMKPPKSEDSYYEIDASMLNGVSEKASKIVALPLARVVQQSQLTNPSAVVMTGGATVREHLSQFAEAKAGLGTGDDPSFIRYVWELPDLGVKWEKLQSSPDGHQLFSGCQKVILWEGENGRLASYADSVRHLNTATQGWRRGKPFWGSFGVVVKLMGDLHVAPYLGVKFDRTCSAIRPKAQSDLDALWLFASSGELERSVRSFHQKLSVETGTLLDVPIDMNHWRSLGRAGSGFPQPFSRDPTQWLFTGDLVSSTSPLQVSVARLLGYSWPDQKPDALDRFADADGVVCLPAVGGEPPAADRLLEVLAAAYSEEWSPGVLDQLLLEVGAKPGAAGAASWLRNGFFKDHCKVFGHRPFIWHIWDGAPNGFSALVNYHRLDRKLLEKITFDYLGNWWLGRVRSDLANNVPGAESNLAAGEQLKKKLELILDGEPPYDIYVRWKSLAKQPMGWDPDLDDGVRLNIRPFMEAGILRCQPKINWNKDRGKNPDGSDRLNDLHYSLAEKRAARGISR